MIVTRLGEIEILFKKGGDVPCYKNLVLNALFTIKNHIKTLPCMWSPWLGPYPMTQPLENLEKSARKSWTPTVMILENRKLHNDQNKNFEIFLIGNVLFIICKSVSVTWIATIHQNIIKVTCRLKLFVHPVSSRSSTWCRQPTEIICTVVETWVRRFKTLFGI